MLNLSIFVIGFVVIRILICRPTSGTLCLLNTRAINTSKTRWQSITCYYTTTSESTNWSRLVKVRSMHELSPINGVVAV